MKVILKLNLLLIFLVIVNAIYTEQPVFRDAVHV
jgi:hypothetical protein